MLHDRKPVPADNGQFFIAEDVEVILSDYFSGRYERVEILENHGISDAELERMLYRLSYEYYENRV